MFRKIIKYTSLLINLFFVLLYLCGLLASVTPSDKFIWFSYFGLIFPILILIHVGYIIFWLTRKKWLFLISLALLLVSFPAVNRTFTFPFHKNHPVIEDKPTITLLTYNVALFGGEKKFKNIMSVIKEASFMTLIIFLNFFSPPKSATLYVRSVIVGLSSMTG